MSHHYQHWKLEKDVNHIVWLGLDKKGTTVNTIHDEVLDELNSIIQDLTSQSIKGVVIYSAKEKGFIAGADVYVFSAFKTIDATEAFLRKGQVVFNHLSTLDVPTVAMIDGFCMGGGYELALACDYRIATEETKIGLPEVLLGIHPGWGGTVRLPRLIGGVKALSQFILTGKALSARRAKAIGALDEVVPKRQLKRTAHDYIIHQPPLHRPTWVDRIMDHRLLRPVLAAWMRKQVKHRINPDHYPAPFAAIHLWEKEGALGDRAYMQEIASVEQLVMQSETARHLIRVFLLRDRIKSFAKDMLFKAHHVHVIGAGTMGGDIAAWCAYHGLTVTIQDQNIERIALMIKRTYALFQKILKQPRLIQAALDKIIPDLEGYGIPRADVVIEAVFENLNVKREIFKRLEKEAQATAVLATNTSSIPLEQITSALEHPERLIGMHFFNPVAKMELVEVVSSQQTSHEVKHHTLAFVHQIKKLPLPVQSSPGFLINRILMPYLMSAVTLFIEGTTPEAIDQAALTFGMVMGPVELADTVGLDVCLAVAENLTTVLGGEIPGLLKEHVNQGKLGCKTGQGFYMYKKGKPVKKSCVLTTAEYDRLIDRLITPLLQEAKTCLAEHVVEDADLLDAGMIFATGFAPFRGGPLHYAATLTTDPNPLTPANMYEQTEM